MQSDADVFTIKGGRQASTSLTRRKALRLQQHCFGVGCIGRVNHDAIHDDRAPSHDGGFAPRFQHLARERDLASTWLEGLICGRDLNRMNATLALKAERFRAPGFFQPPDFTEMDPAPP